MPVASLRFFPYLLDITYSDKDVPDSNEIRWPMYDHICSEAVSSPRTSTPTLTSKMSNTFAIFTPAESNQGHNVSKSPTQSPHTPNSIV